MTNENNEHSIQHIGSTILVVMMEVDPEGEEAFEGVVEIRVDVVQDRVEGGHRDLRGVGLPQG